MESIDDDDRGDYRKIVNEVDPSKREKLFMEALKCKPRPLYYVIKADDREAFICLSEFYAVDLVPTPILPIDLRLLCKFGAINCASALLEHDTWMYLDLNDPIWPRDYPLNFASKSFKYDLVDLFLRHGARTDLVPADVYDAPPDIPVKLVLDMLDYHAYLIDWNPENSIYTLVTILCLPQMRVILETIKLLLWNTKDVYEVFNYYAEKDEGKLVQMAVLIMVAKELLRAPLKGKCDSFVAERMCAYQSVKQEFEFLATLENKLLVETSELKDRMVRLMYVLALFELFDKAGDAIRSYLQSRESNLPREVVIEDVVKILKEARFNMKHEDIDLSNIDLFEPGMTVPHLQKDRSFSQHKVLHPLEYEFRRTKWKPLPNTRSRGLVKQHEPNNMFNPPWSPALRTKPQTNCYLRCCPKAFYKPIKVQNKGITSATPGNLLFFKPKPSNLLASGALI